MEKVQRSSHGLMAIRVRPILWVGEIPLNGNGTPLPFWEGEEMIQKHKTV